MAARPATALAAPIWGPAARALREDGPQRHQVWHHADHLRTYDIFKNVLGLSRSEIRDIFAEWNDGDLGSIPSGNQFVVLGKIDPETNQPLVDLVLRYSRAEGLGKWTAQDALDLGAPAPDSDGCRDRANHLRSERGRVAASEILRGPSKKFSGDKKQLISRVREAYKITVIGCYAQGFEQLRIASQEYKYSLKFDEIARIWKGGCIIRSNYSTPSARFSSPSPA